MLLNVSQVKEVCKKNGRRCGRDFIHQLDMFVHQKIKDACAQHNGGKITLDATVAEFVGIRVKD